MRPAFGFSTFAAKPGTGCGTDSFLIARLSSCAAHCHWRSSRHVSSEKVHHPITKGLELDRVHNTPNVLSMMWMVTVYEKMLHNELIYLGVTLDSELTCCKPNWDNRGADPTN